MEMLARLGDVLYWLACIAAVGTFSVILAFVMLDPGTRGLDGFFEVGV